jgi:hypothetical protein
MPSATSLPAVGAPQVAVEVAESDDVDASSTHDHQVLKSIVERPRRALALREPQMEVVHHGLVAGNGLELIAVREAHHSLARRLGRSRTDQKISGHPLPGAWRRVVEREVVNVLRDLLAISLPDPQAVVRVAVFPIPDVPEVRVDLTSEEEDMRRGERGHRASLPFSDEHAILGPDGDAVVVDHTAELIVLRVSASVTPGHAGHQVLGETLEASVVLVRHRRLVCLGDRFHAEQVRAAIAREAEASCEDPKGQPGERHLEPRSVRLRGA